MVDAAPFRAVRYNAAVAGPPATTSAPAYEDPERFTYARHRIASPYTVLELLIPGAEGYHGASATLRRWFRTGVLFRDERPAFYRYEQHELRHGVPAVQRGLLCAVRLEDMATSDAILAHEEVESERVTDRLDRLDAVPMDLSPVYAFTIGAAAAFRRALADAPDRAPAIAFTDEDGVDHRVWSVTDRHRIDDFANALAPARLVLADGHHRYATAVEYARRRGRSPEDAPWLRTLMYVVDCETHGPDVGAVHRIIDPLPEQALTALRHDFTFVPAPGDVRGLLHALSRTRGRAFALRLADGTAHVLRARDDSRLRRRLPADHSQTWRCLDAAVLAHAVLPRLGLPPGAVTPAIDPFDAASRVQEGSRSAALFLLRPTDIATVAELATAREPMPAKSTLFRPKPRAGLVMREVAPPFR